MLEGDGCGPSADELHHLLGGLDDLLAVFQLLGLDNPFLQDGDGCENLLTVVVKVGDSREFTVGATKGSLPLP